jgi:membrane-bound metal-dependent hydrolase YbcI (DUF457 family)
MNTQTHVIMGAVLLGRKTPKYAWAGAIGGFLPDLPMLAIVAGLKAYGLNGLMIFGVLYWQNWWQVTNAVAHNIPLWSALLAFGVWRSRLVMVLSGSALLHSCIDFLCHREDAHMSFWPFTRWKFMSPVSYYDPQHYGLYFSLFEAALGLVLAFVLVRRFQNWVLRGAVAFAMAFYIAVPAYFILG